MAGQLVALSEPRRHLTFPRLRTRAEGLQQLVWEGAAGKPVPLERETYQHMGPVSNGAYHLYIYTGRAK